MALFFDYIVFDNIYAFTYKNRKQACKEFLSSRRYITKADNSWVFLK